MTIANTHMSEAWNGYEGRHWADHHERYDQVNGGMNEPLLTAAAIAPAEHVLDIGCGTGAVTRLAARQASGGHATGIDLSGPMLDRARRSAAAEHLSNVTFVQGDAQVHPLPDNGFDVAISRGGIMFFADPVAAFGNIRRALRPGGRFAFVCPQQAGPGDDFARALGPLMRLMSRHAPEAPADDAPGPVSLADPGTLDRVLTDAGFADVRTTAITVPMVFGPDAAQATEFVFGMGPMHYNLRDADPAAIAETRATVTRNLTEFTAPTGVTLHAALWLVHATNPR